MRAPGLQEGGFAGGVGRVPSPGTDRGGHNENCCHPIPPDRFDSEDKMNINRRERLWHGVIGFKGRNSFGVDGPRARIPRVARSSQPWALLRNPFGIKRDRKALRWLRDQKLSPIPAQTPTFRKNRIQSVICKIFPIARFRTMLGRWNQAPCAKPKSSPRSVRRLTRQT